MHIGVDLWQFTLVKFYTNMFDSFIIHLVP